MKLNELLQDISNKNKDLSLEVKALSLDSRTVKPGTLFFGLKGATSNGVDYISQVEQSGAVAIVIDPDENDSSSIKCSIPIIEIKGLRNKLGMIAAKFNVEPSKQLKVIAVTGTNGKTSVVYYLAQILEQFGLKTGMIGTLGVGTLDSYEPFNNMTTPDVFYLHQQLAEFVGQGCKAVVIEASSHALEQNRLDACEIDVGIFTNLTRDHLDYHQTMEQYGAAKAKLFMDFDLQAAVINLDDAYSKHLIVQLPESKIYGYTLQKNLDIPYKKIAASNYKINKNHMTSQLTLSEQTVRLDTNLIGAHNLSNVLAVIGALGALGFNLSETIDACKKLHCAPGRMQTVQAEDKQPLVVVDYAHTPDALFQALCTLKPLCEGELICVFGCGGDRDQGKRPQMAEVAEELADKIIITNDNPRTEDPMFIANQIAAGIKAKSKMQIILSRAKAIEQAILNASSNDIILIAGKGHENYQIIGNKTHSFSDMISAQKILNSFI